MGKIVMTNQQTFSSTKKKLRHKLEDHRRAKNITTNLYLKYCLLTGFLHTLPNFQIIGFPKCGTTSLFEYLLKHPVVYAPKGKEIDYFDRLYSKGINWYRVGFPSVIQKFYVNTILKQPFLTGEATPRYLDSPHALKRIKKTIPNAKFIILMRNPIDRAFSHYNMNIGSDYEYRTFEDAIKHEVKRIEGRYEKMKKDENYYSWDYDLYGYLEHGKYVEKIRPWFDNFPKEQFLIIQTEKFKQDPSKIYNQTLKFLGLSPLELDEYHRYKKNKEQSKIEPKFRKQLEDYFKPYNEKLYKLIGQNFHWDE